VAVERLGERLGPRPGEATAVAACFGEGCEEPFWWKHALAGGRSVGAVSSIGNGGGHKAHCPICGKDKMTRGPVVGLPEAADPLGGRQLNVVPFICDNCGFVSLMLAPEQPGSQPGQPAP
jgi:predicted RNA-binding Zn-ribbon protein involved in translation (DUF1610 family)